MSQEHSRHTFCFCICNYCYPVLIGFKGLMKWLKKRSVEKLIEANRQLPKTVAE